MSKAKTRATWVVWFIIAAVFLPLIYLADPPKNDTLSSVLTVCIVFMITALFSFRVQGTDIIVLQGIGLSAFLIFGLFVEAVMTQFGILVYLLSQRLSKNDLYRIPINSIMFLAVSVSAAGAYYGLGGKTESIAHVLLSFNLIPVIGFYMAGYLVNELVLYSFRRWLLKTPGNNKWFDMDMIWEAGVTFLMMPLGIAFYFMYSTRGIDGMFIIAIPMVALSIIIRLINTSQDLIKFLQRVNHLGQKLTEELSVDHVVDLLFSKIPEMLPADYLYIISYRYPEKPKVIRLYRKFDSENFVPFRQEADISFDVYRQGRAMIGIRNQDMYPFLYALSNGRAKSFLSVPMMYHGQVIGVLTMASHLNKAYTKTYRIGMEIVGDFLAIALENARTFEIQKKESERDPLTDLFNYRYLMNALDHLYNDLSLSTFSVTMMDIDDFKAVNDTYGHQNGNAVLVGVANRLRSTVGDKGIIARYGGEEFTVLLPDMDRNICFAVAESIRQSVATEPFMIYIENEHRYKQIHITISIGLSTARDDASGPAELINNADHAMYNGAKRKGKNRVARYVQITAK
ncbi:sensor domain-containing diguanylate cyclase [Sporolactobacillus pectinivorans]|uniref:sensor domain-containing diguanylate cyclase n=1 Tax=Sporolactobacillus pectinivorans TaxID=1591408 RepID=UPI000C2574F0|nr:sensor domain-containing diguanylate cyclase [Sporolactobacillus pectinivorans]